MVTIRLKVEVRNLDGTQRCVVLYKPQRTAGLFGIVRRDSSEGGSGGKQFGVDATPLPFDLLKFLQGQDVGYCWGEVVLSLKT